MEQAETRADSAENIGDCPEWRSRMASRMAPNGAEWRSRMANGVELRLEPKLRQRVDPSDIVQEAQAEAARLLPGGPRSRRRRRRGRSGHLHELHERPRARGVRRLQKRRSRHRRRRRPRRLRDSATVLQRTKRPSRAGLRQVTEPRLRREQMAGTFASGQPLLEVGGGGRNAHRPAGVAVRPQ